MQPIGVVLAGGAGRRMQGRKPLLELEGRPLIAHPLAALKAAGLEAVVVGKPDTPLPPLGVPVLHDASPVRHPLAGIVAALDQAAGRQVVVVAADMPRVSPELLRRLATAEPAAPAVVAVADGALHPLCARYAPAVREALAAGLAAQAPLRATVAALDPMLLEVDPREVVNLNTPDELERARRGET